MQETKFEWSEHKNQINQLKHGVSFVFARHVFFDERRIIAVDEKHQVSEPRFYCMGLVNGRVLTVRFTYRDNVIRIYGAGYWRKGRKAYEKENKIRG